MAKNELTEARYFGQVCTAHPEFNGLRMKVNRSCVQCNSEHTIMAAKVRYTTRPEVRAILKERVAIYKSTRPHIHCNAQQRRQAAKIQRIPSWADLGKIKAIYEEAAALGLTVDHVIPLRGKLVSGLHVHNNLQMLSGVENSIKGNKYVP